MRESYEQFDKPYRRGLVLGLSLAELFLILIFLLLLASVGVSTTLNEEKEDLEERFNELTDNLNVIYKNVGNEITVEDFLHLVKDAEEKEKLQEENETLRDELSAVDKTIASMKEELKGSYKLQEEKRVLREKFEEVTGALESLSMERGRNPPCWFIEIIREGEARQKDVKIFDVKISDTGFTVRRHDNKNLVFDKGNDVVPDLPVDSDES